jgi:hypothetical protein
MFARIGQLGTLGCKCILSIEGRHGGAVRPGGSGASQGRRAQSHAPLSATKGAGESDEQHMRTCGCAGWASTYTHMQQSAGLAAAARSAHSRGGRLIEKQACIGCGPFASGGVIPGGCPRLQPAILPRHAAAAGGCARRGRGRTRWRAGAHEQLSLPTGTACAYFIGKLGDKRQVKRAAHASPRNNS